MLYRELDMTHESDPSVLSNSRHQFKGSSSSKSLIDIKGVFTDAFGMLSMFVKAVRHLFSPHVKIVDGRKAAVYSCFVSTFSQGQSSGPATA